MMIVQTIIKSILVIMNFKYFNQHFDFNYELLIKKVSVIRV